MTKFERTRGTARPNKIEITETNVFVAENVKEIEVVHEDGIASVEYEFDLTSYGKDEYIELISTKADSLESSLTDAQLALCDVFEMVVE